MISIVIPAYNVEKAIKNTVAGIKNVINNTDVPEYEIIIIDDGSTDTTAELAEKTGARVIRHPHNGGYILSCHIIDLLEVHR